MADEAPVPIPAAPPAAPATAGHLDAVTQAQTVTLIDKLNEVDWKTVAQRLTIMAASITTLVLLIISMLKGTPAPVVVQQNPPAVQPAVPATPAPTLTPAQLEMKVWVPDPSLPNGGTHKRLADVLNPQPPVPEKK